MNLSGRFVLNVLFLASILLPQMSFGEPVSETVHGAAGAKIDALMTVAESNGFSGVVFGYKSGETLIAKGYGLADREASIPFRVDTVFDIGSITKQFTAAAIAKLESAGKLSYDQRLKTFFQNVPRNKRRITIHRLLTHSSGLRDSFGDDYQIVTRDQIVERALASPLRDEIGERYNYSNAGYSLLAAIVEIVSGMSYETYLRKELFEPAGMLKTGYALPKWSSDRLAVGYDKDDRWGTPLDHLWADDGPYWNLKGNGGILSTVSDLFKWHQALESGLVLSAESVATIQTPYVSEGPRSQGYYGYGWVVEESPWDTTIIWHNGGNGYFYAEFVRYIDEDALIIVASNTADHSIEQYLGKIIRAIHADHYSD